MKSLEGKVVLVTGAGNGIGRACALLAAAQGARVLVNDIGASVTGRDSGSPSAAKIVVDEIRAEGGVAEANFDSVTDEAAVQNMVSQALRNLGGLHVVMNPAGILRDSMIHKMAPQDWDAVIDVHLRGAFNVSRAAIDHFREQRDGAFVHFTSTSALIGNLGQANYAAAKLGVVGLSRSLALEGAHRNVRSNAIAPFAWTRMVDTIPVKSEAQAQSFERMRVAMRPEQVAPLAVALASSDCHDVTGQVFGVRGNEIFLFNQPRPIRTMIRADGWTPHMLVSQALSGFKRDFTPLESTLDVFSGEPA